MRELAADLVELWQSLGGVESLPPQKRWLCERIVYLRRRCVDFEAADRSGAELPMTRGEYQNQASLLQGHLRTVGLERQARDEGRLDTSRPRLPSPAALPAPATLAASAERGNGRDDGADLDEPELLPQPQRQPPPGPTTPELTPPTPGFEDLKSTARGV